MHSLPFLPFSPQIEKYTQYFSFKGWLLGLLLAFHHPRRCSALAWTRSQSPPVKSMRQANCSSRKAALPARHAQIQPLCSWSCKIGSGQSAAAFTGWGIIEGSIESGTCGRGNTPDRGEYYFYLRREALRRYSSCPFQLLS